MKKPILCLTLPDKCGNHLARFTVCGEKGRGGSGYCI